MSISVGMGADLPYLRQRLAEEAAARERVGSIAPHLRHDSAATIRPSMIDRSEMSLPVPTKDNDWLGFCPSAVKLQNGDRKGSLKKRTDYGAAFAASGITTYYCSAKGCAYMGHLSVDFVWKSVMKDDKLGLKVRWAFLAKSHMPQTNIKNRMYHFQCPVCIYSYGHAEGRVWKGVEIFMDHVSSHRGKDLGDEVLAKLNIINDHVADEKEDFDLCLYPLGNKGDSDTASIKSNAAPPQPTLSRAPTRTSIVDSLWSRKASTATQVDTSSLSLQRTNTWRSDLTRADSVVEGAAIEEEPAEAWSEGLSDFKVDREEDYLSPDF